MMSGIRIYDLAGRTYVGDVVDIPPRYGRDQLLAIVVPLDEIEKPAIEIRNQTLIYSIVFLVFGVDRPIFLARIARGLKRSASQRRSRPGSIGCMVRE